MLVRRAAEALDRNTTDKVALCAMAKQFATDNCYEVVHGAMQVLGGYGFLKDYPLEQFLRDIRVHQILEGTNEVMKMIVSRDLLTKDVFWK
uniref:Acyl-CoA_dh_1 domain-containing protein n=1 Tax=Caenorhabditis japonica TaxID=281687 RepID=A0A8R1EQG4_CAEJA